jgi:DNA replication protein DnaC
MLQQPTLERLYAMRLGAMAALWQQHQGNASLNELSFDERFALLVDAEHTARDNRRIARLLKDAQLRLNEAALENVKTGPARGIERSLATELGSCAWIDRHRNVLITGATGVGKTYFGCALGQAACRRGLRVTYKRTARLFDEMSLAKAEGTYSKLLRKLARADVLILDDLGLGVLEEPQRHDLLELLEDRYGTTSTVITSQLPVKKWHEWIADPTLADAILDRLVHNAHRIELQGASLRKNTKA